MRNKWRFSKTKWDGTHFSMLIEHACSVLFCVSQNAIIIKLYGRVECASFYVSHLFNSKSVVKFKWNVNDPKNLTEKCGERRTSFKCRSRCERRNSNQQSNNHFCSFLHLQRCNAPCVYGLNKFVRLINAYVWLPFGIYSAT